MATKAEILAVLEILAAVYEQEPSAPDAYYWTLDNFDADIVAQAAQLHVKRCKWFPKPSELMAIASPLQDQRISDGTHRAMHWRTMSLLSGRLRGVIDDETLERSSEWKKFEPEYADDMQEESRVVLSVAGDVPDNPERLGRPAQAPRL